MSGVADGTSTDLIPLRAHLAKCCWTWWTLHARSTARSVSSVMQGGGEGDYESNMVIPVKTSFLAKGADSGLSWLPFLLRAAEALSSEATSATLSLSLEAATLLAACACVLAPGITLAPLAMHQASATAAGDAFSWDGGGGGQQ